MTKRFHLLYQALLLVAAVSILTPLEMILLSGVAPGSWFVLAVTVLALLLGYGAQMLFGWIVGRTRVSFGDLDFNAETGSFRLSYAIVPILLAGGVTWLSQFLYRELYYLRVLETYAPYQEMSVFPYLAAVGTFFAMLAGIVLWFYPPERLIGARYFLTSCITIILLLTFMALSGLSFGAEGALCFAVFTVASLILLNQIYISRDYRGTVSVITPAARLYNLRLLALLLGASAVIFAIAAVVVYGGVTLLRMIAFQLLYQFLRKESPEEDFEYRDPELAGREFTRYVYRDSSFANFAFYAFLALLAVVLIWLLCRHIDVFARMLDAIRRWIADFFSFWTVAHSMWTDTPLEILNYKDETTKLQNAAIRDYAAMADKTKLYDDFLRTIRTLPDTESQITYAYLVMLRSLRLHNIPLRYSDTPRECCEKIRRSDAADVIEITDAIEQIKYAEKDIGERGAGALRAVCLIVKKYLA